MTLTYVVTGASRGIGLEFVRQIAAKGSTVFACARNPDSSTGLKELTDGKRVHSVKLDVCDLSSIKNAVEEISKHATDGIDVLINNAGISATYPTLNVGNTPKEEYMKLFETNVCGVSDVTQAFLPLLRKNNSKDKRKKVLNMSSILGSIADTEQSDGTGFGSSYAVSKCALNMVTKLLANHLKDDNVVVFSSHPGWVKTDMGGEKAPITVERSVKGQLAKMETLTMEDSGTFLDYNGRKMPW
ncbi:hypothetical protein BDB01DRAFT_724285 [Pilobolus umbonatus]|nr:hypothetical protein BDB01DRAFT_724285 [Pilobolus umbonatus]